MPGELPVLVGGQDKKEEGDLGGMNRREFIKTALLVLGGALLPTIPFPRVARSAAGVAGVRSCFQGLAVYVTTGGGELWHTHNMFDPNPIWERGALPTRYFVNPRLQRPLVRFFEERWA